MSNTRTVRAPKTEIPADVEQALAAVPDGPRELKDMTNDEMLAARSGLISQLRGLGSQLDLVTGALIGRGVDILDV